MRVLRLLLVLIALQTERDFVSAFALSPTRGPRLHVRLAGPAGVLETNGVTRRRQGAVRLAMRVPEASASKGLLGPDLGRRPEGPDPFAVAQADMQRIKAKIKSIADRAMSTSSKSMRQSAKGVGMMGGNINSLFKRPEKSWRPAAILLLFEALSAQQSGVDEAQKQEARVIAEIVEMMHLATQIHDTVLEEDDSLEKGNPAHSIYGSISAGNKVSLLAGDFLLSRASVLSASLRNIAIVEAVASALQNMMEGQVQMHRPAEETSFNTYIRNTRRRGGMLLGRGCESVALVCGHAPDSTAAEAAREFGVNLGMAYQLLNDLQRTEANYAKALEKIRKEGGSAAGVSYTPHEMDAPLQIAGPLMYAGVLFPELHEVAGRGFATAAELIHARSLIDRCDAVAGMRRLAAYHAALALESLAALPESEAKAALTLLVHYAVEEGQPRLLRANYSPDGVFTMNGDTVAAAQAVKRAEVAAKKELYGTLDSLYGRAATGYRAVKDSLVRSYLGIKDRATSDIGKVQRVAVRDCVLIYGKGVEVGVVVDYVNQQCAFRVCASTLRACACACACACVCCTPGRGCCECVCFTVCARLLVCDFRDVTVCSGVGHGGGNDASRRDSMATQARHRM